MDQQFEITGEYIELNKLLKASGVCESGGRTKIVIENGLVTVDGVVETRKRRKVTGGMVITFGHDTIQVVAGN